MDRITEEMAPRKSWWGRNWLWVVPTGCLGLLLSCGCLGAVIFGLAMKSMSSSDAFTQAVARAQHSPEVIQALGEPISAGWQVQGSIQSGTTGGSAHFTIPLKGSRAEGSLQVEAFKKGEEWTYTRLRVNVADHPEIDLLGGTPTAPRDTARPQDTLPEVEPLPDENAEPAEAPDTAPETQEDTQENTQEDAKQRQAPPPEHRSRPHGKGKKSKDDVEL